MIDAFPFDSWDEVTDVFWQYSQGTGYGTWTLTIIGMIVTAVALVGWVYMDKKMLDKHTERLRAAGFGGTGQAGGGETGSAGGES